MRSAIRAIPLSLAVFVTLTAMAVLNLSPAAARDWNSTREYFEIMDARYADLAGQPGEVTRGTGFKPYQRFKWFAEPRISDATGSMVPGQRWEAWEEMRAIEEQYGTRSNTWFNLGPDNVAGRCLCIEVHPTNCAIAYAGFASSGLWKTEDGGATWEPIGDYLPTLAVSALEIDVTNPNRIWMGTGEGWGNTDAVHGVGLLVSHDAGVTWETTGYDYGMNEGRDVFELEYNPATGTLMLGADNGLWRSTDEGDTFTPIFEFGSWTDVELKRGSDNIMFACGHTSAEYGIHRSLDDGATWTKIENGTPTILVGNCRFALTDDDPEYIYWAISKPNGEGYGIWKSTNGGDSFSQVFSGNHYNTQGWYDLTITVDPQDKETVYSGGVYMYRSTNGASGFSQWGNNIHVDHHATAWAPSDPTHLWIGSDGGVWRSTNSGYSYQSRNYALQTMQFYAINQSVTLPTRALGGTQDNGTYMYNNSPNWTSILGGDGFFCEVDYTNPNTLYAELYYGDHRKSTNGGGSMYQINSGITEQGLWSTPTHMDFSNPNILWTAHSTKIFRTTTGGSYWNWMNNPAGLTGGVSIHQCRDYPEVVAVAGRSRFWITTDGGTTWEDRTSGLLLSGRISDVHVHPNDPNTILMTCSTYSTTVHQVYKTTDQAMSWFPIDDDLPDEPANTIEIDPSNPEHYFLGTDLGVWVSFNAGEDWLPFNTGLPHVVVADLRLHDTARLLRAGTHGRGLWECDITSITDAEEVRPEVATMMLRVFGNPTSDNATLHYAIRKAGELRLGLYDTQGRLLRTLREEFATPVISNLDVNLSALPSGVYFARLDANGESLSRKIIVEH